VCKAPLLGSIKQGKDIEIILLRENIETLVDVCCDVLKQERPRTKPKPSERDSILNKAARATPDVLNQIQSRVPSFHRLVTKVGELAQLG
jgi:hypothetical protein